MALLISYNDADVYDRDADLLRPGRWLNDACINFCLRRLEETVSESVFLFDPALASYLRLQCTEVDEFEELRRGVKMETREWIVTPINDNQSFSSSSSHWSVLLMHVESGRFWHYDSHGQSNYTSASAFAHKLCILADCEESVVTIQDGPQQQNGHDCGVYVLLFIGLFCHLCTTHPDMAETMDSVMDEAALQSAITPLIATEFRRSKFDEIYELARAKIAGK